MWEIIKSAFTTFLLVLGAYVALRGGISEVYKDAKKMLRWFKSRQALLSKLSDCEDSLRELNKKYADLGILNDELWFRVRDSGIFQLRTKREGSFIYREDYMILDKLVRKTEVHITCDHCGHEGNVEAVLGAAPTDFLYECPVCSEQSSSASLRRPT